MDKLIERESATRHPLVAAPALAVQFFLIPLAVIAITVLVYIGFRSLISDGRTARDCLAEVRNGSRGGRWLAAMELWQLMDDPKVRADRSLGPALVRAFEESKGDDSRVRQYLALAIGRLNPPLPPNAVAALYTALDDPDTSARIGAIGALGASQDPAVAQRVQALYESSDAGVRKMVVYALGALPGDAQIATLRTALADPAADVTWNAAVALARHGNHAGVAVVREMLDRDYVERTVTREARQEESVLLVFHVQSDQDPVAEVMITGLRAAASLKDPVLRAPVERLSRDDRSMKVRQAALEALKVINESACGPREEPGSPTQQLRWGGRSESSSAAA
jgi:HEAT repeat protein